MFVCNAISSLDQSALHIVPRKTFKIEHYLNFPEMHTYNTHQIIRTTDRTGARCITVIVSAILISGI